MDQSWSLLLQAFLEQLQGIVPPEKLDGVLRSFSVERRPSIRINTLKITIEEALDELRQLGVAYERVPWCPEGITLSQEQKQRVLESGLCEAGVLYPQSLSSMLATLIFDPQPLEEILDLCAAPGSKTSHIAARMENRGALIANDSSRGRVFRLQANLKTLGVLHTKTVCLPGEWMWKKYPEMCDRVLVDAPCSMEGRFVATEPETFKDWKPAKGKLLAQKQKYLLRSAIACTKSGGVVVYSTCTLNPRENEEVIDWILTHEQDKVVLEDISVPGVEVEKGLVQWNKKYYHPDLKKTIRVLPSATMEGFFVARFKKL